MANVDGTFYSGESQRPNTTPVSPPNAGDDPVYPINPPGSIPGFSSFISLTDTPSTYLAQSLKGVRVNVGETALEFYTIPTVDVLVTPLTGYVVGANTALASTDTILGAFQKVQGQINARVSGTIASGQVAFGTGVNTIGGSNNLFWDNVNGRLGIGTNAPSRGLDVRGNIVAQSSFPTILVNHSGTTVGGIRADGTTKLELKTFTTAPIGIQVNSIERLLILNNGNILIGTPIDSGFLLDVNGTARISSTLRVGTISNGAGDFLTKSATGMITSRTAAEVVSDLGISTGLWTAVGSDIYRNSAITVGRTTIPSNATFSVQSLSALGASKFIQLLNNSGSELFSLRQDGLSQLTGGLSIGTLPISNISALFRSQTDTVASVGLRVQNQTGTTLFSVDGNSTASFPTTVVGFHGSPLSNFSITIKSQSVGGGSIALYTFAGVLSAQVDDSMNWRSTGGAYFGVQAAPSGRVNIRGTGTTTGITLLLEDSAGTDTFQFLDNGNIVLNSTNGNKFGTATTQKLSFWNKTPIVQPTNAITGAILVSNAGTTITSTDTFGGYTLQQLAAILINTGLTA